MGDVKMEATRILSALASEYSVKECCGHFVGGNTHDAEPECCGEPDLYIRYDKTKEAVSDLLKQIEGLKKALEEIERGDRNWIDWHQADKDSEIIIRKNEDESKFFVLGRFAKIARAALSTSLPDRKD